MLAVRDALHRFGINRAVSYAMIAKLWQIPAGAVTTLLIALCFSAQQQGVYYLILTLTGLQTLADAGLVNTILHAASHEVAGGRFDRRGFFRGTTVARGRLSSLLRFALVWFAGASALLVLGGSIAGWLLLGKQDAVAQGWPPLLLSLAFVGLTLALAPLVAILEGFGHVHRVNAVRLGQAITGSLLTWAALTLGAGLWVAPVAIAVQLGWELKLVAGDYRRLFVQLWRTPPRGFRWKDEIWPLQLRIGVQSIARYVAFFPILPVLFAVHGPELAGRYGMTWQVIMNLTMVAYVYLRSRSPEFGRLIAEQQREKSNAIFLRVMLGSTLLLILLLTAFCGALLLLNGWTWEVAESVAARFLQVPDVLLFSLAAVTIHLAQCFAMHIRSQRFDPIWKVNLPSNLALTGLGWAAATTGQPALIAGAILLSFGFSTLALGWLWSWYRNYFR